MTTPVRIVRSISFVDGGLTLEYVTPADDIKANGVTVNHALMVPAGDDYDDEIDAVIEAVNALLEDVLEDLPVLAPMDFAPPVDEDDDSEDD